MTYFLNILKRCDITILNLTTKSFSFIKNNDLILRVLEVGKRHTHGHKMDEIHL